MDQALNQKIDTFIAANKEQILADIAALVAIDSVEGQPEPAHPLARAENAGKRPWSWQKAWALRPATVKIISAMQKALHAKPEKYLAPYRDVDVVPAGNGWSADPFQMRLQEDWMLGRGVADDKGPMVAVLYALNFLKEEGVSLRYPIRALVGDNEETRMEDVGELSAQLSGPGVLLHPGCRVPGLQR